MLFCVFDRPFFINPDKNQQYIMFWNEKRRDPKHFPVLVERSFSPIEHTVFEKRARFSTFFSQKLVFQKEQNKLE
jgi:hypothetical protein